MSARLYPIFVRVTEDHLAFSEDPLVQALRDAFPRAADAVIDWTSPAGGQVSLSVPARFLPGWRTARIRLPGDLCEYMHRVYRGIAVPPATFTLRAPRAAVRR